MNALVDIFPLIPDGVSRHGQPWSDYEDRWIVWLRRERKLSAQVVAEIVGRGVATVYNRYRVLDAKLYTRVEWDDATFARARGMLEDGATVRRVAEAVGRTESSLREKLAYEGVKLDRVRRWSEEDRARLKALLEAGIETVAGMARIFSRSEAMIRVEAIKLGFPDYRSLGERAQIAARSAARRAERNKQVVSKTAPKWTPAALERLVTLFAQTNGAPDDVALAAMARELGSTPGVVLKKARLAGLTRKEGFGAARIARARELAAAGETITRAARDLRCDPRTLKDVAEREQIVFVAVDRMAQSRAAAAAWSARVAVRKAAEKVAAPPRKPAPTKTDLRAQAERAVAEAAAKGQAVARIPAVAPAALTPPARVPKAAPASVAPPVASKRVLPPPPVRGTSVSRVTPVKQPAGRMTPTSGGLARKTAPALAGHDKAVALRAGMDDAIARFLAERGATRPAEDHGVEGVVKAIRARGYSVVRIGATVGGASKTGATVGGASKDAGSGFLIDGRISVANEAALREFAAARGIARRTPGVTMEART